MKILIIWKNSVKYRRIFSNLQNLDEISGNSLLKQSIFFISDNFSEDYPANDSVFKQYHYFRVERATVNLTAFVTFPFHSPPNEPKEVSLQKKKEKRKISDLPVTNMSIPIIFATIKVPQTVVPPVKPLNETKKLYLYVGT